MKTINFKRAFTLILAAGALLLTTMQVNAEPAPPTPTPVPPTAKPVLHVQEFQRGVLNIQFRYVNQDLKQIKFTNNGEESILLKTFDERYLLSKGNSIMLNPPGTKYMVVEHKKAHNPQMGTTAVDKVLDGRFTQRHLFVLPKQVDQTTTKSAPKPPA